MRLRLAAVLASFCVVLAATVVTCRAIYLNGLHIAAAGVEFVGNPPSAPRSVMLALAYAAEVLLLVALTQHLLRAVRSRELEDRTTARLVIGVGVANHLALLFVPPSFSIDVLAYIVHGRMAASGLNPHVVGIRDLPDALVAPLVVRFGFSPVHGPSPYGPLVTLVERATAVFDHPFAAMLAFKLVVLACVLGTAWILYRAPHYRAQDRLLSATAFLFNPLVLLQASADGHNDALMTLFVVAALAAANASRPATGTFALGLGVLTKYVPLLAVPSFIVHFHRAGRPWLRNALLGAALVGAVGLALVLPYWDHGAMLDGLREHDAKMRARSGLALLAAIIPLGSARVMTALALLALIGLLAARAKEPVRLDEQVFALLLFYTLFVSKTFFPWYFVAPIAVAAFSPTPRRLAIAAALAASGLLVAPVDPMKYAGFLLDLPTHWYVSSVAVVVPSVTIGVLALQQWPSRRA